MALTRSQEIAIRAAANQAAALAQSLMALIAREVPDDVVRCEECGGTDLTEAGDVLVCADCNHNQKR